MPLAAIGAPHAPPVAGGTQGTGIERKVDRLAQHTPGYANPPIQ